MRKTNPRALVALIAVAAVAALATVVAGGATADTTKASTDISTLAGKVASVNGTDGLAVRFSAFIEEEAAVDGNEPLLADGATLTEKSSIAKGNVTVNQDLNGAPQNETSIAVDPNNPNRVVGSANDYVTRAWSCTIGTTPCSALGDGYSGTYYSNDGGTTWGDVATDPSHIGTLIPGVERLVGGQYDGGGDPALAFDSHGHVYYAGLGFNRNSAPNTVAVNRGSFDGAGHLSWSAPTFINATTSPSIFNDKEWVAADHSASSPYRDRVYVSWTRFIFNPIDGSYVQSPINFAYSSDGGQTFSSPQLISGNVLYGQGSRPVVGPDGAVYVFWDGSTRLSALDSTYMVKSTDGGVTWSSPLSISTLTDIPGLRSTKFRVNSYPAAAAGADGKLYVTWNTEVRDGATSFAGDADCAYFIPGNHFTACSSTAVYSTSSDGGATWSDPQPVFAAATRQALGYPIKQPDGTTLTAPAPRPVEDVFPAVTAAPNGAVYFAAYRGTTVQPWQSCAQYNPAGSIQCLTTGLYKSNTKLVYTVQKLGGRATALSNPINTRYNFSGGFIGDYTDIASGSDGTYHALWTDTNNHATINWWYGTDFGGVKANQQDVVTASGQ